METAFGRSGRNTSEKNDQTEHTNKTTKLCDTVPKHTPDDIPELFEDHTLSKEGPDGAVSPLVEILRGMETCFSPDEVWGAVDNMLRSRKYAGDASQLAALFVGNEDADSFGVRYDILYGLCADDDVDVKVRADALTYLSSLAFGRFENKNPCYSLYHTVKNPTMLEELSQHIIMSDLAATNLSHFRSLLRGICLLKSRGINYDKTLSSAMNIMNEYGKSDILASVNFVARHECLPDENKSIAKRLLQDMENADAR